REANSPASFIEVGTWFGASTAYLASRIKESGKNIRIYAIDNFTAEGSGPLLQAEVAKVGGNFFTLFRENLRKCGIAEYVTTLVGDSTEMAGQFDDASVDFAYIDACHEYRKVRLDILAWAAKVKVGGIIAGHDYNAGHPGVIRAVDEVFGREHIHVMRSSWLVTKTRK
ncbi:MAG TPA: class I SAM-dependent methyltransferase, partial [Blastocatellia bacterium]|nr:class I SAM-dependent methyltransferase [Blastocatellia bacterium]